jgi:hypothetical protein
VRFLLGFDETEACIEMAGRSEFICRPEKYSLVRALFAKPNCFFQELFAYSKPSIFGMDEEPAKLSACP